MNSQKTSVFILTLFLMISSLTAQRPLTTTRMMDTTAKINLVNSNATSNIIRQVATNQSNQNNISSLSRNPITTPRATTMTRSLVIKNSKRPSTTTRYPGTNPSKINIPVKSLIKISSEESMSYFFSTLSNAGLAIFLVGIVFATLLATLIAILTFRFLFRLCFFKSIKPNHYGKIISKHTKSNQNLNQDFYKNELNI